MTELFFAQQDRANMMVLQDAAGLGVHHIDPTLRIDPQGSDGPICPLET